MKLLVLLNNYQGDNSSNTSAMVERVLKTYASYEQLAVDVVLFSTAPYQYNNFVNLVYPTELSHAFAYVPRQWLFENFSCLSHDYFMYAENDLIVPETSVLSCIDNNEYLLSYSDNFISGFIRYENKKDGKKYIDMLPDQRPTVEKILTSNKGRNFWIPGNLHSGNFLLSHHQLDTMIDHQRFQVTPAQYGKQYYGILESAASDVYLDFIKALPEDFTTVEIEHVPNKYEGLSHLELSRAISTRAQGLR